MSLPMIPEVTQTDESGITIKTENTHIHITDMAIHVWSSFKPKVNHFKPKKECKTMHKNHTIIWTEEKKKVIE